MKITFIIPVLLITLLHFQPVAVTAQTWQELYDSTNTFFESGDYSSALSTGKEALKQAEKEFGRKDTNYTNTLKIISHSCFYLSNSSEALKYAQEEINILKEILNGDNRKTGEALNDLAFFYQQTGDTKNAERIYNESLDMYRRLYPENKDPAGHIETAAVLNNLATLYQDQGNVVKADKYFNEALKIKRYHYKDSDGPDELNDLIISLNNMGYFYTSTGAYTRASELFKEALSVLNKLYPKDKYPDGHKDIASLLLNIGEVYRLQGDLKNAEKNFKKSLDMKRKLYRNSTNPLDRMDLLMSLNNISVVYSSEAKYIEAEKIFLEMTAICNEVFTKELFPDGHQVYAAILNNLAGLYDDQGKYLEAESVYLESLEMRKKLFASAHNEEDNIQIGVTMNNLGLLYINTGRFRDAEKMLLGARQLFRQIFSKDKYPGGHPKMANVLNNLAVMYKNNLKFRDAEEAYKESLDIYRQFYPADENPVGHPDLMKAVDNLAILYREIGRMDEAEKLSRESLDMARKLYPVTDYPDGHPDIAKSLLNLGGLYVEEGKLEQVGPMFNDALNIFEKMYPESEYPDGHPDLAGLYRSYANMYFMMGDVKKADKMASKAVNMYRKIFDTENYPDGHPDLALSLVSAANLVSDEGKFKEAEKMYRESNKIYESLYPEKSYRDGIIEIAQNYADIALFYEASGKLKMAASYWHKSLDNYVLQVYNQFPFYTEKEKEYLWKSVKKTFNGFNSFAVTKMNRDPEIISQVYNYTLITKGLLLNSTKKTIERIKNSGDTNLIALFTRWHTLKNSLINYYKMTPRDLRQRGIDIDSLEELAADYEKQLIIMSAPFEKEFSKKTYTWKDIAKKLKDDEAAIEIIRIGKYGIIPNKYKPDVMMPGLTDTVIYAALIVTSKTRKKPDMVVFRNGNELESVYLREYNGLVSLQRKGTYNEAFFNKKLKGLYKAFWQPVSAKLSGIKTVYISLDGVYNQINLNTLISPEKNIYLQDELELRIISNTKDIIGSIDKAPDTNNKAILIGNPKFNLDTTEYKEVRERLLSKTGQEQEDIPGEFQQLRSGITPLPGTKEEIEKIASYMDSSNWVVDTYMGKDAVEEAVKTADNPRVLHIATHGKFLKDVEFEHGILTFGIGKEYYIENPLLRSYIVLAGAEKAFDNPEQISTDTDDGLLTAYEAMNLNLDKTELVVLSACETGLGEVMNGEGVYGMQRAFLVAGAKDVIISLWKVSDQSTKELMTSFYKLWLSGMDKRDAFREAQKELRNNHPGFYYWGAFVMVGE